MGKEVVATLLKVFPTHVGVNRMADLVSLQKTRIPHARGGEPYLLTDP